MFNSLLQLLLARHGGTAQKPPVAMGSPMGMPMGKHGLIGKMMGRVAGASEQMPPAAPVPEAPPETPMAASPLAPSAPAMGQAPSAPPMMPQMPFRTGRNRIQM